MCKDCGSVLKFFIFGLNTILFLLGICLAGVAGYTAFNPGSMIGDIIKSTQIPGAMTGLYILMAVGIVMAIIAIFGCIGATGENRLLLWLNFFFVLLLFIMQLVAVILCFYKFKVVEGDIRNTIKQSAQITSSKKTNNTAAILLRSVLGLIESKRQCCGLNGPKDYGQYIPSSCRPSPKTAKQKRKRRESGVEADSGSGERVPTELTTAKASKTEEKTTQESSTKETTTARPYKTGCIDFLKPYIYAAGGIGIAVLLLEFLLLIFVGMLLCEIGKSYESLA